MHIGGLGELTDLFDPGLELGHLRGVIRRSGTQGTHWGNCPNTRCEGLDHSHDCSLRIEEIGVCIHSEQPTRALSVNFILKKYVSFGMLKE